MRRGEIGARDRDPEIGCQQRAHVCPQERQERGRQIGMHRQDRSTPRLLRLVVIDQHAQRQEWQQVVRPPSLQRLSQRRFLSFRCYIRCQGVAITEDGVLERLREELPEVQRLLQRRHRQCGAGRAWIGIPQRMRQMMRNERVGGGEVIQRRSDVRVIPSRQNGGPCGVVQRAGDGRKDAPVIAQRLRQPFARLTASMTIGRRRQGVERVKCGDGDRRSSAGGSC